MRAMCASTDLLVTTTAIRQPIIRRLSAKQSQFCCAHRMRAVSHFVFFFARPSPYSKGAVRFFYCSCWARVRGDLLQPLVTALIRSPSFCLLVTDTPIV